MMFIVRLFFAAALFFGIIFAALSLLLVGTWLVYGQDFKVGSPQCHGTRELRGLHDKRAMAAARGITDPWNYELDHYVPLCLGGADEESNLRFQRWPDARQKDETEAMLCEAVCSGRMAQGDAVLWLRKSWPEENEK